MRSFVSHILIGITCLGSALPSNADAFCGFFVAKADAELFNEASQVVMVHDAGKTVLTMVNDYQGDPKNFALVVPVPVVLKKEVVRVTEMGPIDHLDAFTAPRLAEYHDPDPCSESILRLGGKTVTESAALADTFAPAEQRRSRVRVEASFTVGEYDIVILSAEESNALESWLRDNGYDIPKGAASALRPYVRTDMKFFVARVNLENMKKSGFQKLRPLQFAFKDPRFMLPIRLGMINANGPQELLAYVITKEHRAEVTNYRNVKIPTNENIPTFARSEFEKIYSAAFDTQVERTNGRAVFTEYAWNMAWCDPCAANPLSRDELESLGVWWLDEGGGRRGPAQKAFVTRLHARYDENTFPEDLMLKVTSDRSNYQVRYVLRHPHTQPVECSAARDYFARVIKRREDEIRTLASLTGWSREKIREQMEPLPEHFEKAPEKGFLDQVRDWFGD